MQNYICDYIFKYKIIYNIITKKSFNVCIKQYIYIYIVFAEMRFFLYFCNRFILFRAGARKYICIFFSLFSSKHF